MERNKIADAFPTLLTNGAFFDGLSIFSNQDFALSKANAGLAYFARSGDKLVTSLVAHLEDDDGVVTSQGITTLTGMLDQLYNADWTRILEALYAEYSPIQNYELVEDGTDSKSGADTLTDTIAQRQLTHQHGAQQDTHQHGAQSETYVTGEDQVAVAYGQVEVEKSVAARQETVGGGQDTHEHQVAAFNSSTYQASQKDIDIIASRTNSETAHVDTDTTSQHTDTTTTDERTDTKTTTQYSDIDSSLQYTDTDTESQHIDTHETEYDSGTEHHLTRKGNIGVTTSQQMIESELELRKNNFYERMCADIDKYLALACY